MTNKEAMESVGLGKTAYFRWCRRLGIRTWTGITEEDFKHLKLRIDTNPKVQQQKRKPDYYRVILQEPFGYKRIIGAGLTLPRAKGLCRKYVKDGYYCYMKNCRTNKCYYV